MSAERGRLESLQAKAEEILAPLPAWDGESPAVWVKVVDPVTQNLLQHRFVPVDAAPQSRTPHLYLVGEAS